MSEFKKNKVSPRNISVLPRQSDSLLIWILVTSVVLVSFNISIILSRSESSSSGVSSSEIPLFMQKQLALLEENLELCEKKLSQVENSLIRPDDVKKKFDEDLEDSIRSILSSLEKMQTSLSKLQSDSQLLRKKSARLDKVSKGISLKENP